MTSFRLPDPYEWYDPVELAESAIDMLNILDRDHREAMARAARAFADVNYQTRRQAEVMIEQATKGLLPTTATEIRMWSDQ